MPPFYRKTFRWLPSLILVTAIFFGWELYVKVAQIPAYILPPPSVVWRALMLHHNLILTDAVVTLTEMLVGLALGLLIGSALAVPLAYSPHLRDATFPLLIALEGIPKLALAPIVVIWLGIGLVAKIALVALVTFFPLLVQLSRGLRALDEEVELFIRTLCAPEWKVFLKVRMPAALPFLFDALRLAIPLAMVGAVISEFISSEQGLGHMLLTAVGELNMALAFVALLTMAAIAVSGYVIMLSLEWLWLPPWRR